MNDNFVNQRLCEKRELTRAICAIALILAAGAFGCGPPMKLPSRPTQTAIAPPAVSAAESGQRRGRLASGKVRIRELLRLTAALSGKTVIYPTEESGFAEIVEIEVIEDIDPLSYELLKVFLEIHGYRVADATTDDGVPVIKVTSILGCRLPMTAMRGTR